MSKVLDELQALKRVRNEDAPFGSLQEFEDWVDAVQPLLVFDEKYQREFAQSAGAASTTCRVSCMEDSYPSMNRAIGVVNRAIKTLALKQEEQELPKIGFEHLLQPLIIEKCLDLYVGGHLREAVLNSVIAVFDLIRARTKSKEDGDRLIGSVMSLADPKLILSEVDSESGQNDQKGFMQIFKGVYQGIRNPKSHSLDHDLDEIKAGQYLVFSSLLARRVEQATVL